jgi:hypothetical protein
MVTAGLRYGKQLNEPGVLGFRLHSRWKQADRRELIHGGAGVAQFLVISLHAPLPADIQQLPCDPLACADGGLRRCQHTVHVLRSDGFGRVIPEEVVTCSQAANDDYVLPAGGRNGGGHFRQDFIWGYLAHAFLRGVNFSRNSRACCSKRAS